MVVSTGVLRKHGWSDRHPPCTGSGKLPLDVAPPLLPTFFDGNQIDESVVEPSCVSSLLEE